MSPPEKEVGPQDTTAAGTDTDTSSHQATGTADFTALIWSRQVSWWSVYEHVTSTLAQVPPWPTVGTPAWCLLADADPRKLAALYDAAQHWALRLETSQHAQAEASQEISAAADWKAIASECLVRQQFYALRPWLKRVAS